jgi:hypothetical protein
MKLFGRTSGYYLFWTGFVYFWVGMYLAFTHAARPEIATLGFVLALSVPLWCPPVARYFNMEPIMFDLFKKKKMPENVVPFPAPKAVAPIPYIEPPKEKEKPAHTYYRLGLTDNNRISLSMGYSEITMNAAGIDSMIALLETYRDLLREEEDAV